MLLHPRRRRPPRRLEPHGAHRLSRVSLLPRRAARGDAAPPRVVLRRFARSHTFSGLSADRPCDRLSYQPVQLDGASLLLGGWWGLLDTDVEERPFPVVPLDGSGDGQLAPPSWPSSTPSAESMHYAAVASVGPTESSSSGLVLPFAPETGLPQVVALMVERGSSPTPSAASPAASCSRTRSGRRLLVQEHAASPHPTNGGEPPPLQCPLMVRTVTGSALCALPALVREGAILWSHVTISTTGPYPVERLRHCGGPDALPSIARRSSPRPGSATSLRPTHRAPPAKAAARRRDHHTLRPPPCPTSHPPSSPPADRDGHSARR